MRSVVVVAVALLLPLLQNERAVFRSAAEEVRVDVLVTDGNRPVAGLTAMNFELKDGGVVQKIENVEVSELPFSLQLALDTSSSMEGTALRRLQDGARAAIDALRPGDRASILTFNAAIGRATPWTADGASLRAAIDQGFRAHRRRVSDAVRALLPPRGCLDDRLAPH
ncbi:MAG TPA: VWA domain-containing protein [Vicinamibacterales bacterium]|nr:VWA domain-containing protein [Vicinamibacterales bacterium]